MSRELTDSRQESAPRARKDLEYIPVQHEGKHFVLIRDPLGLVQEGEAIEIPLYQFMVLLDGKTSVRDLQTAVMRQRGGILVSSDEIKSIIAHLDESFFLDSERFRTAKGTIVAQFVSNKVRPSSHSGRAYPADPRDLARKLNEILALRPDSPKPEGRLLALVAPHIDLSVGGRVYSSAYRVLKGCSPKKVIILGTGHQMTQDLFALSEKAFETPLGVAESERLWVEKLKRTGVGLIAENDFVHRAEHSIEFQLLFLQHLLPKNSFKIVPILCGNLQSTLSEYSRAAYVERTGRMLEALRDILQHHGEETLLVAGVDFSHIGPKFGHEMPAQYMKGQSEAHDQALLNHLIALETDSFWKESRRVKDQYNVCGFAALACLLETMPPCKGHLLGYERWHEEATRSAVSYAAVAFTAGC
jgi:AmmeMemoRadiSam system protein B